MLVFVQLERSGGQDVHTHPGCTSSVDTTVADDQLHNFRNFAHRVALRHTRQDRTQRRTAEQSCDIPACPNGTPCQLPTAGIRPDRGYLSSPGWQSLTVLLTGPRERIPSSSRNFFLQRTIEQLLEG